MAKKTNFQPMLKRMMAKRGYMIESVEKFNMFTQRKSDLLGCADFLCLNGKDLLLVQVTDHTNASKHKTKIDEVIDQGLDRWLAAGGRFWLVYFKKIGFFWHLKIQERLVRSWKVLTPKYIKD